MNLTQCLTNYINRYAPSKNRVIAYLEKKNSPNITKLLEESGYDESMMCDIWMRSFISLGKGKQEIKMKLSKKEFPKNMIIEKLDQYNADIYDWETNKSNILHQIHILEQRGKSRRMISSIIISRYSYFRDEIQELLGESDDSSNLQKEVQKYKNRYNIQDKKNHEKMVASLIRKGFSYSDIKNVIRNM